MKRILFFICTALVAAGCQRSDDRDARSNSRETPSSTSVTSPANPSTTTLSNRPADDPARPNVPAAARGDTASGANSDKGADNTGRNERDRSASAKTSGDQGGSEADRQVTQQIRKTIVDDAKLSMSAKNVKIITEDGAVTLRGPVKSTQEKTEIAAIAQKVDGVKRVDNQLEIAK